MDGLVMPTHVGWMVSWETGKQIVEHSKTELNADGSPKVLKVHKLRESFRTTSKEIAERKLQEVNGLGFEGAWMSPCIF